MRKIVTTTLLVVLSFALYSLATHTWPKAQQYKAGDIIFISNPRGQGLAIQLATKSKYTHVGIILKDENGKLIVYHAVEPVRKNTIEEFINMSADGTCEVMRLRDTLLLNEKAPEKLRAEANKLLGKHYDIYFGWSDSEIYCSEFVWKVYNRALGLEPGPLKPLGSFDLSSPAVKQKLTERYGNKIPLDEKMISPGDMHDWKGFYRVN